MSKELFNKVIGITGGIGSGKSVVADIISELGYTVLSSDVIAKELIQSNKELQTNLINIFGEKTYIDGKYNAEYIASLVFGNNQNAGRNLEKLNNAVHPFVIIELIKKVDELFEKGESIIFNESALIFEAGLDEGYDYIINVDSPIDFRISRTKQRTGLSEEEIKLRMSFQISPEEKKRLSDFTIDNSGSLDDLKQATVFIVDLIKDLPAKDFTMLKQDDDE